MTLAKRILAELAKHENTGLTMPEIRELTGIPSNSLSGSLRTLEINGHVYRPGEKRPNGSLGRRLVDVWLITIDSDKEHPEVEG